MHITPTNKFPQGCNSGQCHHIYKEFEAMMYCGISLDFDWFPDRSYGKFLTLLHQSSLSWLERKSFSTQCSNSSLTSSLAVRIWHVIHCGTPVYQLQISSNGAHMKGPGSIVLQRSASLAMKGS
jgi:hypothetical protein